MSLRVGGHLPRARPGEGRGGWLSRGGPSQGLLLYLAHFGITHA